MKIIHCKTDESGYSLIEVMAAITILGAGILAIALLQISAIQANAEAMKFSEANALIEDRIELFKQTPYDQITNDSSGNPIVETNLGANAVFIRRSTIVDDVPVTGVKTITVQVTWTTKSVHSISYQTIISR